MLIVKKILLFWLTAPGLFFIIFFANALVFSTKKFSKKFQHRLFIASTVLLYIVTTSIITKPLLHKIEGDCSFDIKTLSKIEAIVVLTGGTERDFNNDQVSKVSNTTIKRLVTAAAIYNSIKKPVIIMGGKSNSTEPAESLTGAKILTSMGIPVKDIVTEEKSINTYENITELEKVANQLRVKNIALVSSASHMPRIKKLLKDKELKVTFIPTACNASDRMHADDFVPSIKNMELNLILLYELLGNIKYAIYY